MYFHGTNITFCTNILKTRVFRTRQSLCFLGLESFLISGRKKTKTEWPCKANYAKRQQTKRSEHFAAIPLSAGDLLSFAIIMLAFMESFLFSWGIVNTAAWNNDTSTAHHRHRCWSFIHAHAIQPSVLEASYIIFSNVKIKWSTRHHCFMQFRSEPLILKHTHNTVKSAMMQADTKTRHISTIVTPFLESHLRWM